MSKDETPTARGLLSKVVRFVRNPTVNWNELDSIESERESQYSKQVLKDMLERKRRNDFIRRREFDQLRKLRQRDALNASQSAGAQQARPSLFGSTLTSPDERAGTIRKIDEIEAQMSKAWWKGPGAGAAPGPAGAGPAVPPDLAPRPKLHGNMAETVPAAISPHSFAPTAPLSLPMPLAAPQAGPGQMGARESALGGLHPQEPSPMAASMWAPLRAPAPASAGSAADPGGLPFAHNPDLEEAAILFANGDSAGAEASLREVLAQRGSDPQPQQFETWMALFDLYRATGQHERFGAAGLEFATRFHRSEPLWFSLPEQLGLQVQPEMQETAAAPVRPADSLWNAPAQLTAQSVATLQAWLGRSPAPWTLVWKRLAGIDDNALAPLADVFLRWADQPVHLVFTDAQVLQSLLQAHTVSGERSSNPQWWRLRMAALRFMNQPEDFEMVALDYCVTYEVSPPSWQIPECTYRDAADAEHHLPDAATATTGAVPLSAGAPLEQGAQHWSESSMPALLSGSFAGPQVVQGLQGHVLGDANELLDAMAGAGAGEGAGTELAPLRIDCARLIRVDFAAAGSVLNWAARQQSLGRALSFERMHRLAAVFFNVIGINEYAQVRPRRD